MRLFEVGSDALRTLVNVAGRVSPTPSSSSSSSNEASNHPTREGSPEDSSISGAHHLREEKKANVAHEKRARGEGILSLDAFAVPRSHPLACILELAKI
jgi:hypothetical protein